MFEEAVLRKLADQMEYEVEFAHNGKVPGLDKYHVHVRCAAAWEAERAMPIKGRKRTMAPRKIKERT